MKKLLLILLALTMCVSMSACGESENSDIQTTVESEPSTPEISTAQLKETVSTDIVDFTLEHSKLTYYVSDKISNYVEATDEENTTFGAKIGTCCVSMTVTIKNKNRGGSFDFGGSFWEPADWSVTYNGKEYGMYDYTLNGMNYDDINLTYSAIINKDTGKVLSIGRTSNMFIDAGKTITLRFFGIIHVDPKTLNDGFELNVKVPNSKGEYEDFKYIVPAI